MSIQIAIAKAIAVAAHKGQTYGGNLAYITHPAGVATRLHDASETQVAAAWLHDVLEDTELTKADLVLAGVADEVVAIVETLTRHGDEAYSEYIDRVSQHPEAIPVKIADLEYNLSHNPKEHQRQRYTAALSALAKAGK